MLGFSWGAFAVYLATLTLMVAGGLYGLIEDGQPAFLAPILMGLFFFYLTWEAVVRSSETPPPGHRKGR